MQNLKLSLQLVTGVERLIWDKLNDAENGAAQSGRFKDKNSNIDLGNNNVGHKCVFSAYSLCTIIWYLLSL